MEELSNVREAYFDKPRLAWTVLSLLWELAKTHRVVWLDSGDNWILHGHYCLANPVYVDSESDLMLGEKKTKQLTL